MSFKYTALAWKVKCCSPAHRLTILVVADFADDDGKCWPSQKTLAERTGLGQRTIRHCLASFEAEGLISRKIRSTRKGRSSDIIYLHLQPAAIAACSNDDTEQPAALSQQPAAIAEQPAAIAGNPINEPINEPVIEGGKESCLVEKGRKENARLIAETAGAKLPTDWRANAQNIAVAKSFGLTDADIEREEPEFRQHNCSTGAIKVQAEWDKLWRKWVFIVAMKLGRTQPLGPQPTPTEQPREELAHAA